MQATNLRPGDIVAGPGIELVVVDIERDGEWLAVTVHDRAGEEHTIDMHGTEEVYLSNEEDAR